MIKSPAQGAKEGVTFIKNHLIETTSKKFDDFAGSDGTKNEYQLSIQNYNTARRNVDLSERIEKKQRTKFFEGISSSFDLLQAQG